MLGPSEEPGQGPPNSAKQIKSCSWSLAVVGNDRLHSGKYPNIVFYPTLSIHKVSEGHKSKKPTVSKHKSHLPNKFALCLKLVNVYEKRKK